MFYVYNKNPSSFYEENKNIRVEKKKVYAVSYKNGYPFFTFYEDGKWITRSAKHYIPVEEFK